jgi:hypothetical protein
MNRDEKYGLREIEFKRSLGVLSLIFASLREIFSHSRMKNEIIPGESYA